jgi:hypothetical protein
MAIATRPEQRAVTTPTRLQATPEQVWREIERASFAVVGYVTPSGEARSSGVVYKTSGKRLYFAVAPDSWKARHIAASRRVSVTVPVHRGGILALVAPIPPATISFHAAVIVHPAGSVRLNSLSKELGSLLPPGQRDSAVLIELIPEGRFLTYGVGVSLTDMRKPELAEAVVPVAS